MSDPLGRLQKIAEQEGVGIRAERAAEEERLRVIEEERMTRLHEAMAQQAIANDERSATLVMAWATAELLTMEGARPHTWTHKVDQYETRGKVFPREKYVGTANLISLQGWPLLSWQEGDYDTFAYKRPPLARTVVLAQTPVDESDSHLVVVKERRKETTFKFGSKLKPKRIQVLPDTPLTEEDVAWPAGWETPPPITNDIYGESVKLDTIGDLKSRSDEPGPEFAVYNNLGIEKDIQQALGRLLALHGVFEPATAMANLQAQKATASIQLRSPEK